MVVRFFIFPLAFELTKVKVKKHRVKKLEIVRL